MEEDIFFPVISSNEIYQLFYKIQDGRLFMLIEKRTLLEEVISISYRFTYEETPLLEDGELLTSFDRWKADPEE